MQDNKMIKRDALDAIRQLLKQFPVVAVIGARQSGKSTLCSMIGQGWKIFDLEKEQDYQAIEHDPYLFFQRNPRKVIIDTAQELAALFPALRVVVDQARQETGRFLITGSSSPDLVSGISESLAGRVAILELGTLKSSETGDAAASDFYGAVEDGIHAERLAGLAPLLDRDHLFRSWFGGGYPEAALKGTPREYRLWMDNYRATYLQRDIRKLFPGLKIEAYRTFLSMLANLSGTIINHSELARSLAVSQPTARQYVDIAHGTFIWRKIEPFTRNVTKRVTKMPRGHIRDSGLLHFMLNIGSEDDLLRHPIVGRSWEAFITEEIIKGMNHALIPVTPYYYRTRHGAEIDLILEGHFGLLPIEIKYGSTIDRRSLRAMKDFIEDHLLELGIVINNADSVEWLDKKILRLPATVI